MWACFSVRPAERGRAFGADPSRDCSLASGDLADVRQAQMDRVHPDDLARLHEDLQAGIGRRETIELAYRVSHPDGTLRHVVSCAWGTRCGHCGCDGRPGWWHARGPAAAWFRLGIPLAEDA